MLYILDFHVSIEKGFCKLKGGGEGIDFGCAERPDRLVAILQGKHSGYLQQSTCSSYWLSYRGC